MAEASASIAPALAPAATVLDPRALQPAGAVLPTILPVVILRAPPPLPRPDSSTFTPTWFLEPDKLPGTRPGYGHFKSLLEEHNQRLPSLRKFREAILACCVDELDALLAGTEAPTNFLQTMVETHQECLINGVKPAGTSRTYTGDGTITDMYDRLQSAQAWGHPGAYDPWNGWWTGIFESDAIKAPKSYHQLHIWEPEIVIEAMSSYPRQQVQAVTQVDFSPEDVKDRPDRDNYNWFISSDELLERPVRTDIPNYGINVWSEIDGLTGYVIKKLNSAQAKSMPHIGFLIDPDVLIWVAFEEDRPGDQKGSRRNIMLFAEAGFRKSDVASTYCIRGAYALLGTLWDSNGKLIVDRKFGSDANFGHVNQQLANYREVAKFRDFGSLELALKAGQAGNMHPDAFTVLDRIVNFR